MTKRHWETVDLFCGIGGLTRGLLDAGLSVVAGVDIDESCRYAYEKCNDVRFIRHDIHDLTSEALLNCYHSESQRILVGCAPCQPFSRYSRKRQSREWSELPEFLRLIRETSPTIVSMENVPGLCKREVFARFVEALEGLHYIVDFRIADASEYGVPQHRKRLVLLGSRIGRISLLSGTELGLRPSTVRDAIGDLPALMAGETDTRDSLHCSAPLSPINLKRIRSSRPGGTWRDWPVSLRLQCQTEQSTYPSVYGRMQWDEPAPTITTQFFGFGNGRFGHPEQDRALSLREGAILQTFPRSYEFCPNPATASRKEIGRHIGNAVPPKLAYAIGMTIMNHIAEASQ